MGDLSMPNSYNSSHTGEWQDDLFNLIYPIGSVYISVNDISPATLFGGTWEQIQDKFIMCAGSTYAGGTSGGSITSGEPSNNTSGSTAITVDQMPSHTHRLYCGYNDQEAHTNDGYDTLRYQQWARGGRGYKYGAVGVNYFIEHTGGNQGHTHTLSSHTHNTTPPYIALYVWKRTA